MLTGFLTKNLDIVFFLYGLAFFTMGMAIFMHPRRQSNFKLSDIIWLLAFFGLTHGLNEWLDMFDLVKPNASLVFDFMQLTLLALSYVFFFEFGRRLMLLSFGGFFLNGLFASLLYCSLFLFILLFPTEAPSLWPRYLLGFPGGILTALGFLYYYRANKNVLRQARVRGYFFVAALSCVIYGILGGLIVPKAGFFPASVIHTESFLGFVGIPVQMFRALCAGFLAWSVWNILGIFDWEVVERHKEAAVVLAAAEAEHKRLEEAERLYRELETSHLELKATQYQLVLAEKMQLVGRLSSGVAHEVKNPLAIIMQSAEYLKNNIQKGDENIALALKSIEDAVSRSDRIIKDLLDFSAMSKLEIKPADLNRVIDDSLSLMKYQFDNSQVQVKKQFGEGLPLVEIDKNRIEQALVNICLNAAQAMPKGGELSIKTYKREGAKEQGVIAEIKDTGPGIPADILDKIFEPFFTTKRDIGGTGLGLWVVKNIIELHGGKIEIRNRQGSRGIEVSVFLKTLSFAHSAE